MAVSFHSSHIQNSSKNGKQSKCPSIGKYLYIMSSCNRALPRNKKKQAADTSNSVDENSLKRIHTMWFHLHGTLEKTNWASLVAQLVKNPPAMWRPGFNPWVGKIPWKRELHILAWKIPWTALVHSLANSQPWLSDFCFILFLALMGLGFPRWLSGKVTEW